MSIDRAAGAAFLLVLARDHSLKKSSLLANRRARTMTQCRVAIRELGRFSRLFTGPSASLFTLPAHRLALRVLRLDPHLRRAAPVRLIRPFRHDALKAHVADVPEHGRAVIDQMLNEPAGVVLSPADLSGAPLLALRSPAGLDGGSVPLPN